MIAASGQHKALLDRLPRLASTMVDAFQRVRPFPGQRQHCFPDGPQTATLMATLPSLDTSRVRVGTVRRFGNWTPMIFATLATGLIAGIGSVVFHYLADSFGHFLFSLGGSHPALAHVPIVVIVPTVGLALVGIVLQLVPEARIGGVKEVFDSLEQSHGFIPFRRINNVILSGLVLAFGGSVGPEGPMIQLGALAGSLVGRSARVAQRHLELIVQAGAAAGIAAAFRSPAGGVLLVLELFGARFNRGLAAIGAAAVVGYVTRTAIVGDAYPFRPAVPLEPLPIKALILVVPLMGLTAALAGHLFIRMFNSFKSILPQQWPLWLRVGLGGLVLGLMATKYPQILSGGYPVIQQGLGNDFGFRLFLLLLGLKMLSTSISFGSGAVGGLFAPTLVIGAMFGGAYGHAFNSVMPSVVPQPELFVLLGMVAMFGSIAKGHWSGLLMVADMSGCYHQLLLPGVVAGGISLVVSWEMHDLSIFGLPIDPAREFDRSD
jgi:chloride channel protein, CIC family